MVPAKQMENRYKANVLETEVCFELEDEWEGGDENKSSILQARKRGFCKSANSPFNGAIVMLQLQSDKDKEKHSQGPEVSK